MFKIQNIIYELEKDWSVWYQSKNMEPGNMNINISIIKGGETYSALADSCEIIGSVLVSPDIDIQYVINLFEDAINSVTKTDTWLTNNPPKLEIPYILDEKIPVNTSSNSIFVKSLSNAYKQIINKDPVYKCSTTTSDANYLFNNVKDIITFGPGNIESGVHGPNECIDIEKLINCTKIYALTILELDNQLYN